MKEFNVFNLVFSLSVTVYSDSNISPISEDCIRESNMSYGKSKLMIENVLEDLCKSDNRCSVIAL